MSHTITEHYLPNGLKVMLKEIHSAAIISHWTWYRVGSRDEIPGGTGLSHWVEHMQFKGTPKFPGNLLDKAISREGGVWNAFTYVDWTTFLETMPADKIDLALKLEADRMVNSIFDPDEVESERTVIISERQGHENEPTFQLNEAMRAAAFKVHPYHHEIIGDMADLRTIQRDALYQHYRNYYIPNNAVLSIAGDFETEAMLDRIHKLFEPINKGVEPQRLQRPEPPQSGEHRITVEGPDDTVYVKANYRAPSATNSDFFPFVILDSLLTGASSLNMFGGGISNKTSRLYRRLIDGDLAVGVYGGLPVTIDPFIYAITLTVHPQRQSPEVIVALDEEIDRIQNTPPTEAAVQQALKQAKALFAYGSESISNQAFWLGFSEMFDHYEWFTNYLDRLAEVTPDQVQRIAQSYLRPQNRILGTYLPTNHSAEVKI